jgi:hypothetical protein
MVLVGECDAPTESDTDHESDDAGSDYVTVKRIGSELSDRSDEEMEHGGVCDARRDDGGADHERDDTDAKPKTTSRKHIYERSQEAFQHLRCIPQSQRSFTCER